MNQKETWDDILRRLDSLEAEIGSVAKCLSNGYRDAALRRRDQIDSDFSRAYWQREMQRHRLRNVAVRFRASLAAERPGLALSQVERHRLKTFQCSAATKGAATAMATCPICMEAPATCRLRSCRHTCCPRCLRHLLKPSCPECRADFFQDGLPVWVPADVVVVR